MDETYIKVKGTWKYLTEEIRVGETSAPYISCRWAQLRGISIAKKIDAGKLPVAWISAPAEKARSDQRLVILATASLES